MRVENLEKVIEKLATTERSTIVVERAPEGKIRVTSGSWEPCSRGLLSLVLKRADARLSRAWLLTAIEPSESKSGSTAIPETGPTFCCDVDCFAPTSERGVCTLDAWPTPR